MPVAFNPKTGETVYLGDDGQWTPAQTAVNPQTKQMMAYDGKAWAEVPAQSRGVLGYIDDAVRSIASGATFGFADKLAAKGDELFGRGTYEDNLAAQKARDEQIPGAIKYPGEIAGAVGGALATAPVTAPLAVASGLTKLPGLVRAMGGGAAAGALYGAGDANPGDELKGAAEGAGVGAITGAAMVPVAAGASRVVGAVKNAFSPRANVAADLSRAITRDETTPAALLAKANEASKVRPGVATLADVGGENVRGLVERVAQTPGAGRTQIVPALTERQQGQLARVSDDLRSLTGTRRTAMQATQETMEQRARSAAPLYQRAYAEGDRALWSPGLERLSSSPTVKGAMAGAVRIWRDNSVAEGYGAMNPGALVDRGGQLSFLSGKVPVFPNLQFWDYTKRIIDDKISAAVRAGQGQKVRTLSSLAESLRGELDKMVPSYSEARSTWAGPSRYMDAITEGSNILKTNVSAEQLAGGLANMTSAEQEAYRIGAVSTIIGKMGNDPAKLGDMTKYLRSPEMRKKIAALMPNEQARRQWAQRLAFEVSSSELTGRALGNSATARRLAERGDSEGIVGDLVMDAFMGHPPVSLLRRAVGAIPRKVRDTLRSKSDHILAELLTDPQSMSGLQQAIKRVEARDQPPSRLRNPIAIRGATAIAPIPNLPALQAGGVGRAEQDKNNVQRPPGE